MLVVCKGSGVGACTACANNDMYPNGGMPGYMPMPPWHQPGFTPQPGMPGFAGQTMPSAQIPPEFTDADKVTNNVHAMLFDLALHDMGDADDPKNNSSKIRPRCNPKAYDIMEYPCVNEEWDLGQNFC